MARIKIQDLPSDMALDQKILKKIIGGTAFRVEGTGEKATIIKRKSSSGSYTGISDLMNSLRFGTSSNTMDTDGDGWVSWEEYQDAES